MAFLSGISSSPGVFSAGVFPFSAPSRPARRAEAVPAFGLDESIFPGRLAPFNIPYTFRTGSEGYLYVVPGQRPVAAREDFPAVDLLRGARFTLEAAEILSSFTPFSAMRPSLEDTLAAAREERIAENRQAMAVPVGDASSVGAPASISGPVSISGPAGISGPSNTVSGPPLPLNRRLDTLGRGSYADGDLDGPFDLPDYRALYQALRERNDDAYLRQQSAVREAGAVEDARAFARQQALWAEDEEWARAAQDAGRADAFNAFAFAGELAESSRRAADMAYFEERYRTEVDMDAAYARNLEITAGGQAETEVRDIQPVDVSRAGPEAAAIAGHYPLDRPDAAIFAPPPPAEPPHPPAEAGRQTMERWEQSPERQTMEEERGRASAWEEESFSFPERSVGLAATALAPLSIGISFTV
jgi:hypothetical protein